MSEAGLLWLFRSRKGVAPVHLLINGVDLETGRRIVTSTIDLKSDAGQDSVLKGDVIDFFDDLGRDVPAATAVMNSARFPFISPPGRYAVKNRAMGEVRQVIDGGYYENYGVETALELIDAIESMPTNQIGFTPKPALLVISNDVAGHAPELHRGCDTKRFTDEQISILKPLDEVTLTCDTRLPLVTPVDPIADNEQELSAEFIAPLKGIVAIRAAHGTETLLDAKKRLCGASREDRRMFHMALARPVCAQHAAPMNWVLHDQVKTFIVEKAPEADLNIKEIANLLSFIGGGQKLYHSAGPDISMQGP